MVISGSSEIGGLLTFYAFVLGRFQNRDEKNFGQAWHGGARVEPNALRPGYKSDVCEERNLRPVPRVTPHLLAVCSVPLDSASFDAYRGIKRPCGF
jgi:hypothetical protein